MKEKNVKILSMNHNKRPKKMCHRTGWIILRKSLNFLSQFIIFLCLSNIMVHALLNELNEHYDLDDTLVSPQQNQTHRKGRYFPFYTLGRFVNTPCVGSNQLMGTCVLMGECKDAGGVATGGCNSITRQAICCVYQQTCGGSTSTNNTYFVSPNYPGLWSGGSSCSLTVNPCSNTVCQLRVEFQDLSLAGPSGDGICNTDVIQITGGSSSVPNICGENSGSHVVVDFDGTNPIQITIAATSSFTFGRHWFIRATQINCDSAMRAPSGCLQYHYASSGIVRSFNYSPSPNSLPNTIGVEGSRQIANLAYGICIQAVSSCSITYSILSSDVYSFTMTGDVGAVDPSLLGTGTLQEQLCTTDYLIIPNPSQGGTTLTSGSDRFCGLGLTATTSNVLPYVLYVITDANENLDIGNRGFALNYAQNECPVI
ncbi:uncharacterized protein LOC116346692 [Contarinia nasturtii]|uniref:uncharacterized protein LOC116346692 n=1 Tax=Contarinia nasturtii TaxID=265458 RepID=UPI0012D399AF|nr:uncharacterized protein LOC116346692 [Contarinia nasturtii]